MFKVFHTKRKLADGAPCVILAFNDTAQRLNGTCFRERKPLAGNFASWASLKQLFANDHVRDSLLEHALECIQLMGDFPRGRHRIQIECPHPIGWSGADEQIHDGQFNATVPWQSLTNGNAFQLIEPFRPNQQSNGLRVLPRRTDAQAPLTRYLTIAYEIGFNTAHGWMIQIWTVYPGKDIGRLKGNVSKRTNCVFFDFNHPGQPLLTG